jgi:hypothetical protein
MKTLRSTILSTLLAAALPLASATDKPAPRSLALDEHLEPLRAFIGKTWKGHFKESTPEKPQVDIARWERALNGKAIRVLHSINDGVYGGESLIFWDAKKKSLVFFYFTTAGFYTTGTMTAEPGKLTGREVVTGEAEGVTEVKSVVELRPDGSMVSKAEFLKGGKWEPAHEIIYREEPKAEVNFK